MKQINLSEELINVINNVQERYDLLSLNYGYIDIRKKQIEEEIEELDIEYKQIRKIEADTLKKLKLEYGEGEIDIENKLYLVK